MNTLNKSLRCLGHPLTLLSLAVLIVNDHLLKWAAPSWLTGKLSDVAGLFFFPFLMAALLSLPAERLRVSTRRVGPAAFVLTALWFTAIKTVPLANALTERMVTALVGLPAQIVLDPTDLLALPVLLGGWWLWSRVKAGLPLRRDWLALGVAALATLATSPATARVLDRVIEVDGVVYVHASDFMSYRQPTGMYATSDDGGHAWTEVTGRNAPAELYARVDLPKMICGERHPETCYRITGEEQIDVSRDGGETWEVAWAVPYGREAYRERLTTAWSRLLPEATDLALVELDDGIHVFATMGTEGLLTLRPDGRWCRRDLLGTRATPFSGDVGVVFTESVILAVIGTGAAFALQMAVGSILLDHIPYRTRTSVSLRRLMKPVLLAVAGGIIVIPLTFVGAVFLSEMGLPGNILLICGWPLVLLTGFLMSGRRMARIAPQPKALWATLAVCLLVGVVSFVAGWAVLALWALGTITMYGIALGLAFVLVPLCLGLGAWWVRYLAYRAVNVPTPDS